jgi:hypothetical protein
MTLLDEQGVEGYEKKLLIEIFLQSYKKHTKTSKA